ncbi:hypothetical protein RQP46_004189 [Phenoliferia psychrophenolica]
MAPTSSAPSLRSLTFPPEVLLHIISFASESLSGEHYMDLNERNADLASLALVNRAFQEATYSVLYGDLRLSWVADKVKMLFRSFEENHHLLPLVRRLEATALHRTAWINDQVKIARDNADHLKQASFDTYCEQEGIEEDSQEWLQVVEDTFGSKNSALEEAWAVEFRKDAEDAWKRNGHGAWRSQGNREGAHEFLDIITSAPALRSLLVCGFKHTLSATDIDIASRGPYPLIEYLEVPHLHTSSPFFVNHTLPSLLASSTPNLRSLRGHLQKSTAVVVELAANLGLHPSRAGLCSLFSLTFRLSPNLLGLRPQPYTGASALLALLRRTSVTTAPPSRFPPEILLHILSFASASYSSDHYTDLNKRNADLASLALVSRAFQEATYSVLYGDLRLAWMADKVKMLCVSLNANLQLLPLVRRVEAIAVQMDEWVEYQVESPSGESDTKQKFLEDYCKRIGIEEDSPAWWRMMDDDLENTDAEDEGAKYQMAVFKAVWNDNGHGTWLVNHDQEGALEFLDLVESAPALRSIVVHGFWDTLSATEIAKRGPYPLVESLETTIESPFVVDHTLPSLLTSWAPNLRSLSGHTPYYLYLQHLT